MHLKTFIKIAVFCVSMLILKMVGKSNIFGILCFIISENVKNTTEKQKKKKKLCAAYEEGTVTDQTHQKWFAWTQFHSLRYQRKTWVCDRYLKCFLK